VKPSRSLILVRITDRTVVGFYAGLNLLAWFMIFCFVRETKQLTLEEIDRKLTCSYYSIQEAHNANNFPQRSSQSQQASSSATKPKSGSPTSSSATFSA
jgi:hypothetical protein